MVDVVPPLRIEPLLDQSGNLTIRYAEYFENVANDLNDATVNIEDFESFFSEVQQVQSFTAALSNDVSDVDRLSTQVSTANARIYELEKQVEYLSAIIGITDKADIAVILNKIKGLEALV